MGDREPRPQPARRATTSLPLLLAGWAAARTGMGPADPALVELAAAAGEAGAAVTVAVRHAGAAPGILAAMFAVAAALALGLCAAARRVGAVSPGG